MRYTEGQVIHLKLEASKRVHTIHLHGMEPDPRNDGVGHTSYEVSGSYTYQWKPDVGKPGDPNQGAAGSYFYHCHVNTVLHVQMGMAGPMVIDPIVHPDFPLEAGARRPFVDGPLYDIATETLLAPYALDPRWHEMNHAAGLSGEDVGLNRFNPKHFFVLGGPLNGPRPTGEVIAPTQLRVNTPASGRPTLFRMLNLNYFPSRARFTDSSGKAVQMAELIAHDGRAFRDTSHRDGPAPPVCTTSHRLMTDAIAFGAAERYDVLLHPPSAGTFMVHVDFLHWATNARLATRSIPLIAR
jgi:hypothetical protein